MSITVVFIFLEHIYREWLMKWIVERKEIKNLPLPSALVIPYLNDQLLTSKKQGINTHIYFTLISHLHNLHCTSDWHNSSSYLAWRKLSITSIYISSCRFVEVLPAMIGIFHEHVKCTCSHLKSEAKAEDLTQLVVYLHPRLWMFFPRLNYMQR